MRGKKEVNSGQDYLLSGPDWCLLQANCQSCVARQAELKLPACIYTALICLLTEDTHERVCRNYIFPLFCLKTASLNQDNFTQSKAQYFDI